MSKDNLSISIVQYAKRIYRSNSLSRPLKMGREEKLVGWSPPPVHWLKLNTDGAFRATRGMASAEGIIRDENGDWISGFGMHIGPSSPLQAELWAVLQGLTLCWDRGLN